MRVLAIDPGVTGALAVISGKPNALKIEAVHDLPTYAEKTSTGKVRRYVDAAALRDLLVAVGPCDRVVIERLVAPPGIASTVAFSLGATAATLATVFRLLNVPVRLVSPAVWKKALNAPADKEASRQYASRLFKTAAHWQRKKDHNRAEAALIAAWGALTT